MNILKTLLTISCICLLGVVAVCVVLPIAIYLRFREGDFFSSVTRM